MPRKKKRSAKQLANDKRLGRMAKKRAAAKRSPSMTTKANPCGKKKVAKRSTLRKRQTAIQRATNPRRKSLKKSHLWLVFRCKGKQIHYLYVSNRWTVLSTQSILFRTQEQAKKGLNAAYTGKQFDYGIASADMTSAQIRAGCRKGK